VKTLYLLRHASAAPAAGSDSDLERPLDARGRAEAAQVAGLLCVRASFPELALCSPARRARETLDALQRERSELVVRLDDRLYLASPGEILARVQDLENELHSALVVGHNPGIAALARSLAGARDPFPTAFLAAIGLDGGDWADFAPGRGRLLEVVRPERGPGNR
jgi:phosphohistidine phosphatase